MQLDREVSKSEVLKKSTPKNFFAKTSLVVGELLLTFGMVVFLFLFYLLFVTNFSFSKSQSELENSLENQWSLAPDPFDSLQKGSLFPRLDMPDKAPSNAPPTPERPFATANIKEGAPLLRLFLPGQAPLVVVSGVAKKDLEKGPGHIPGTSLPGKGGNVVLSGHRTTYGAPFSNLDKLNSKSLVEIETKDGFYYYQVFKKFVVLPSNIEVANSSGSLEDPPLEFLTLTTCHPKYSAKERLIIQAKLVKKETKL